jgi:hypothetical protein
MVPSYWGIGIGLAALLAGCGNTSLVQQTSDSPYILDKMRTSPQHAQKVRSARPQRVKGRGGTDHTLCGPFAPRMDLGERESPSSASDLLKSLWHIEGRTMRERCLVVKGAPMGKEAVLAASERAGEVAHRGWVGENRGCSSTLLACGRPNRRSYK